MTVIYSFFVPTIHCVMCERPIKQVLSNCPELLIEDIVVDVPEKMVSIVIPDDTNLGELQQKLKIALGRINHPPEFMDELEGVDDTTVHWMYGLLGSVAGVGLLLLSFVVGSPSLLMMLLLAMGSTTLTLVLGMHSYKNAWNSWRHSKTLTMDSLFTVSTLMALVVSLASIFLPWLPMMFETGLLIFGFRHLGLAIETSLRQTVRQGILFAQRLPKEVTVFFQKERQNRALHLVKPGEIIEVRAGDIIPLDGLCLNEGASVFKTITTGATWPCEVKKNDPLLAGMRVAEGQPPLLLQVIKTSEQSYLKRLDRDIFHAKRQKAPLATKAEKLLRYFIPGIFIFAVIAAGGIACFFPLAIAIRCFVAVVVSACPCTIGFILPAAVMIGMNKAAKHGVRFRNAEQLQRASEVQRVLIDLHGTLTTGIPEVTDFGLEDETTFGADDFFTCIAVLEKNSTHWAGRALGSYARANIDHEPLEVAVDKKPFGVMATMDKHGYALGSQKMMEQLGINVTTLEKRLCLNAGDSVIYLARDKKVVGYVVLTDPLRPDARLMMDSLKQLGLDPEILTGADQSTAQRYCQSLGLTSAKLHTSYTGAADAENKRNKPAYIKALQNEGLLIGMIGDSANDALALASSDFGLAISSASVDQVTLNEAGAVIGETSLLSVVTTFAVARQTMTNTKQNLMLSLTYNVIVELLAGGVLASLGVVLNPAVGVALMIVQMCLILANAYRLKHQPLAHLHLSPNGLQPTVNSSYASISKQVSEPCPQWGKKAAGQAPCHAGVFVKAKNDKNSTERLLSTHLLPT